MTGAPRNTDAALRRAAVLCDLGRWDDAIGRVRAVLAIEPHNEEGLHLMARAYYGKDDDGEALRWSLAAIAENPESEWAHRIAALASQGLGRREEACSMAREAVRLAPQTWQCHLALSQVLTASGSGLPEARAAADRVVELAPNEAAGHFAVGQVAAAEGRTRDAKAAFSRALALDPSHSATHNEVGRLNLTRSLRRPGRVLGDAGGLAKAAGGFATAVRSNPRAAVSRRNLDLVLELALQRQTRGILLAAWMAMLVGRLSGPESTRVATAVLLILPAFFALRFALALPRESRDYPRQFLLRPPVVGAVASDLSAVALLVAGATFPRVTSVAFGCAVALAIAARAIMCQRMWLRMRSRRGEGRPGVALETFAIVRELLVLGLALLVSVNSAVSTSTFPDAESSSLAFSNSFVLVLLVLATAGGRP
jgi:tetratricopeptide (TPR) repeat protein